MSDLNIRFAPDVLRRLGEELNPHPHRGILELVKNAYDADATTCSIRLHETERPGGRVIVEDNGEGMTADAIRESWLVLGRSSKTTNRRTELGRVPSGSKGLGRLAALRMGETVELSTRPKSESEREHLLLIDWREFDKAAHVEDVGLTLRSRKRATKAKAGTEVEISELRQSITRADVKRLARELILLADPFVNHRNAFQPILVAPEFADLEKLVATRYFDDAEYYVHATVDGNGFARAVVTDWRKKELFSSSHEVLAKNRQNRPYQCPRADFDLWVFILDSQVFATRASSMSEVQEWLRTFGGVHLYQNDLRVSPYGDPGNDWLELNLRRAKSPEERPSTNTVLGRVVVHDKHDLLVQKTDRSGFIETEAFTELRAFAQDVTEWLARRRLDEALKRRAKERAAALAAEKPSKRRLNVTIDGLPSKYKRVVQKAADAMQKEHRSDLDRLRKEIQLYRTLSTAGITAATFAHESSGNPIKVIRLSTETIARRGKTALKKAYDRLFAGPVESIIRAAKGLSVLAAATLNLLEHEKRRLARVDVHQVIQHVLTTFQPFFRSRNVEIITEYSKGNPYLRCSEAALESIFTNLFNNSLTALESTKAGKGRIAVSTEREGETLRVRVADSGPGIVDVSVDDIWLPGVTTRPNGTGLGLTIVRDTVFDLGGKAAAIATGALGGAEITIELPLLGS